MTLDYSLTTPEERTSYVSTLDLNSLKPLELEICANYILHPYGRDLSNSKPTRMSKNVELNNYVSMGHEIKPSKGSNRNLTPRTAVPWEHPNLTQLATDIETLKADLESESNTYRQYKLRTWIRELRMDARERVPDHTIRFTPTFTSTPDLDIEEQIDFGNSFHVKQLIAYYTELRQSDISKCTIEYLDKIIERAPLESWEKHLLVRYIDKLNAIIIARELATEYNHVVYPGYLSKTMRRIYRLIAEEAMKVEVEWNYRDKPQLWRKCPACGERHPNVEIWWRKGQRKCKQCLSVAKEDADGKEN